MYFQKGLQKLFLLKLSNAEEQDSELYHISCQSHLESAFPKRESTKGSGLWLILVVVGRHQPGVIPCLAGTWWKARLVAPWLTCWGTGDPIQVFKPLQNFPSLSGKSTLHISALQGSFPEKFGANSFNFQLSKGNLMWRVDSFEKTLMLGKIEGRRRRGWQRMRWLDGITDSMDMGWVNSGSWWWTGRPGVRLSMGSQRVGHDWATELNWRETLLNYLSA